MGQSASAPYPFVQQVDDTIEQLQETRNPHGWQLLINQVCQHRSVYLEHSCSVAAIDQILYQIANACPKDLLHSRQVTIPCLSIRWVQLPEDLPKCMSNAAMLTEHQDIFYATTSKYPLARTCMKSAMTLRNQKNRVSQNLQSGQPSCDGWHSF